LSFTGDFSRLIKVNRVYSSVSSFVGEVSRLLDVGRIYSGIVSFAGIVTNVSKTMAFWVGSSVLSLNATLSRSKTVWRTKSGSLSFSGLFSLFVSYGGVAPYIALIGVLSWVRHVLKTGVLSFSAAVTYVKTYSQRFLTETRTGTQAFIGSISYNTGNVATYLLDASIFVYGVLTNSKVVTHTKTGILNLSSTLYGYLNNVVKSGSVNFEGWISYLDAILYRAIGGSLNLSGAYSYVKFITQRYTAVANQTFQGIVTYVSDVYSPFVNGILSFSGSISKAKELLRTYSGSLGITGALDYWSYEGYLKIYEGAMSSVGSLVESLIGKRSKIGVLSFSGNIEGYREIMYYGVVNP